MPIYRGKNMKNELVPSLKETIFKPIADNMSDVLIEIAESGIDSVLPDGVIKEIPIIKTINSLCKAGLNIREKYLIRKTAKFLVAFKQGKLSEQQIQLYRKQLESNPKKVERELGRVIILLERMLEEQQADMLGKIYISYIRGDISWDKFIELSEVNERMFPVDYGVLGFIAKKTTDNTDSIPDEKVYQIQRLQALGLVMERAGNLWVDLVNKYKYDRYLITPLGKILIDLNEVPTEGKGVAAEQ